MNDKNLELEQIFRSAINSQQQGNFKNAENLYKKILEVVPNHINTLNNLATIHVQTNETKKAIELFEKVLAMDPNNLMANENLGIVSRQEGECAKAIEFHKKVIGIDPKHSKSYNNLAINYKQMGELELAKSYYKKAIEVNPTNPHAYNNLGILLGSMNEKEKALDAFKKSLEIEPNFITAQVNIANAYIKELNVEKAIKESHKALSMHNKTLQIFDQTIPFFRFKHDLQQAEYLEKKNYKIDGLKEFIGTGKEILKRYQTKENFNASEKISLTQNEIKSLLPFYKAEHIYDAPSLEEGCINPNKDWNKVEEEYINSPKQIMYIDDFLSERAIKELREFCLVSKIWIKQFNNRYLGALSDSGFINPLHLQLATDLKTKLPKIFGNFSLGKFWGFKYDAVLGGGIGIHADFAYHNLNFWITPDEYNNNKNAGGLKVYDAPAPENWTFTKYNSNHKEIYKFLTEKKANCTTIPYKFNRAVLFNSAYFHETDKIDFKDGYESRRINVTYLFGDRLSEKLS